LGAYGANAWIVCCVRAMLVVVPLELGQFPFEISRGPLMKPV